MPAVPVPLPDLGAGGQPLSISAWFVELNDVVEAGDCIVEVLMCGMTCDVATPVGGIIAAIVRDVGDSVNTGDILAWIEPSAT